MTSWVKKTAVIIAAGAMLGMGAGVAQAGAGANGVAAGSSGVLSGNVVQVVVNKPTNICGNAFNVFSFLNTTGGNTCINA